MLSLAAADDDSSIWTATTMHVRQAAENMCLSVVWGSWLRLASQGEWFRTLRGSEGGAKAISNIVGLMIYQPCQPASPADPRGVRTSTYARVLAWVGR